VLAAVALIFAARVGCQPARVATAYASHVLCSGHFVSGLDPSQVYQGAVKPTPGFGLLGWGMRYQVDEARHEVRSTLAGRFEARARYRSGLGCLVVNGEQGGVASAEGEAGARDEVAPLLPELAGPEVVEPADPALRAALDQAFAEPRCGTRATQAVVVVQGGRVIAERYAPPFGPGTPMLGWSMAKSVLSALVGILVRDGKLSAKAPAPVAAWSAPGDPRAAITLDQLLRQTSGLSATEDQTGLDASTRMLFLERDMAGFAERAGLGSAPGTRWAYASTNYLVLSRILRDAVGGRAGDVVRFVRRELFDPLGMRSARLEFDATGTPIGSSFAFATARDWARFGVLYAQGGVIGGRRILPEGWVDYSRSQTLEGPYAAGFWRGEPKWRRRWGVPEDLFYASGFMGQRLAIVPSEGLVIARFGETRTCPLLDLDGFGALVAGVREALRQGRR
jgi:CubicO group peptidase (beta-lactamase class C family)